MTRNQTTLIVGGGASGALLAANLLRQSSSARVLLVDPSHEPGRGMAYSTNYLGHLLNVPAGKMTAFPDEPWHFQKWLHDEGLSQYGECSFVPRMIYGDYLAAVLRDAVSQAGSRRFEHVRAQAVGLDFSSGMPRLRVEYAGAVQVDLAGDFVVLALGNAAPAPWPGLSAKVKESGRFFGLTWSPDALQPEHPLEPVMLLGTGLTAVDAAIALRSNGHRGPIYMVSRRGLLPEGHRLFAPVPMPCAAAITARGLLRNLRLSAKDSEILYGNWRVGVDGIRAQTNTLWQGLSLAEQRRFHRHARPYWDTHRHRMAPEIHSTVHRLISEGTLRVFAGRVGEMEATGTALRVSIHHRGNTFASTHSVARIINCTGPESDLERLPSPLVRDMLAQGSLLAHPLRTGALVSNTGALVGRDGEPNSRLFALGPIRTGTLLETVAIPEIRQQAADLSRLLAGDEAPQPELQPVWTRRKDDRR